MEVWAVPRIVVDGEPRWDGAVPEAEFLRRILSSSPVSRKAAQTPARPPRQASPREARPKALPPHASGTSPPTVEPTATKSHMTRLSMKGLSVRT
jgi:hypothetical protein